jgi:hypothetical protein
MRFVLVAPALLLAGAAVAEEDRRNVLDPRSKVPPLEYRSAFEGYRPFSEQDIVNWRRSNDEVRAAGGHAGVMREQGDTASTSKPQPGKPQNAAPHGDHGAHK